MKVVLGGIKKSYGDKTVLDIDNLEFRPDTVYAVMGPNGSGKSTMLKILAGTIGIDSGVILYDGGRLEKYSEISYMPQKPYIFDMSTKDNVLLGIEKGKDAAKKALDALEYVGMRGFSHVRARSLSGGEAQRVAVARTLAAEKRLVLLDEPASATDILNIGMIEDYLMSVQQRHKATIIFTTHNPSQAMRIADEIIVLWNGRIIERGKPEAILNNPQKVETKHFLESWRI